MGRGYLKIHGSKREKEKKRKKEKKREKREKKRKRDKMPVAAVPRVGRSSGKLDERGVSVKPT